MNRRVLRAFSFVLALSAFAFGFTACENKNNKHNHEYGEWIVVTPATCTEAGEKRKDCACGDYITEEIPPIAHEYEDFICSVCGQLSPDAPVTENLQYTENGETAGYCVTGLDGECGAYIKIPSTHNGKPVTAIGESAFYNCENLRSVAVGDSVTVIGELAFADCYALEGVTLGNSVKTVGDYAFSQCTALRGIDFPSSVETIGECAFVACSSLDKATFKDGLKSIGDCAFGGCTSLKSFIMPDSVTSLGWGALMFDVSAVGFEPVDDTTNSLTRVVISNCITEIPDFAFSKSNIKTVEIGNRVTRICYSSFYGCGQLESAVVPKSLKTIQSYAFYRCPALDTVYYAGTAEEWDKITIGKNGNDILSATKYFYSETKPETDGNFWHYVDGNPVKW